MSFAGGAQSIPASKVLDDLKTTVKGLDSQEAQLRQEKYGKNVLEEERPSRLRLFLHQFKNVLVYILFIAAAITLIVGDYKDFAIIIVLILFNSLIGFVQEIKAEASIRALRKLTESRVSVLRDGAETEIPSSDLVPGDIVVLREGDLVVADLRLTQTDSLSIDESMITGESIPVEKDAEAVRPESSLIYEMTNCAISGTLVSRGNGQGVVVATGKDTYIATVAKRAKEASPESPLTKALSYFTKKYVVIVIVLLAGLGTLAFLQARDFVDIAYLMVAQLVSAVPEGLPLVITLVMVIGAMSLSRRKTLTRYLPAVETLGCATVIASDKTGTITQAKLTVDKAFALDLDELKLCAAVCNDSDGQRGDSIDVATARWVGDEYKAIKERNGRVWSHPFDSKLRMMATQVNVGGKNRLFVKGAYEALKPLALNKGDLLRIEEEQDRLAEAGLRVLAFGVGDEAEDDPSTWRVKIIGLLGFLDPPKDGVKEAVLTAQKAGLRVLMITGDHPKTARAVAEAVGIWRPGDEVLTGKDLEVLDDAQLFERLQKCTVLARTVPDHKYRVVKVLQGHKEIVAVTGDGVNDVPALRAADLGIAMGSGTEAAKSASKMVIVDNNLGIIVDAIRTGRVIADNIRKVIYYLLSTNINQLVLIALALVANLPLPLIAIQILWINLVTDGVQDKTFPFAKEEGNVMGRRPRDPNRQFFDRSQLMRILFFGVTMGWFVFQLYIMLLGMYDFAVVSTIVFTSMVMIQWVNGIQAQKENEPFLVNFRRSFSINPYVYLGVLAGLIMQLAAIYLLSDWFSTVPLALEHWAFVLMMVAISFIILESRKLIEMMHARWKEKRDAEKPRAGLEAGRGADAK